MSAPFDLVLGRKTYDIFAAYWPHASEEDGAKPLNDATKYVASRNHPALEWGPSALIEGDAADGVETSLATYALGDNIETLSTISAAHGGGPVTTALAFTGNGLANMLNLSERQVRVIAPHVRFKGQVGEQAQTSQI